MEGEGEGDDDLTHFRNVQTYRGTHVLRIGLHTVSLAATLEQYRRLERHHVSRYAFTRAIEAVRARKHWQRRRNVVLSRCNNVTSNNALDSTTTHLIIGRETRTHTRFQLAAVFIHPIRSVSTD